MSRPIQFVATDPEPSSKYTPAYREFFARLRKARIEKALSLLEVAELVGLDLPLAYEVENLIAPLPFEWLEVWCQVVGVPFADYLVVYWASEEAYAAAKEALEREAIGINSTDVSEADESESPATELSRSTSRSACAFGFLNRLRPAFARVAGFFLSRFPIPFFTFNKTPE